MSKLVWTACIIMRGKRNYGAEPVVFFLFFLLWNTFDWIMKVNIEPHPSSFIWPPTRYVRLCNLITWVVGVLYSTSHSKQSVYVCLVLLNKCNNLWAIIIYHIWYMTLQHLYAYPCMFIARCHTMFVMFDLKAAKN